MHLQAGIDFIIRDDSGVIVSATSIPIFGKSSILAIKALAILQGLKVYLSKGMKSWGREWFNTYDFCSEQVWIGLKYGKGVFFYAIKEMVTNFDLIK